MSQPTLSDPIVLQEYFVYNRNMDTITKGGNIAVVAELIGDPSRAIMLNALMTGRSLPAGELAYRAGITPQTASAHLAKLVEGGLLTPTAHGRHRYYALANAEVAHALEALTLIAPPLKVRSLRDSLVTEQLRCARTCYDHLAGRLGVDLTQALVRCGVLRLEEQERRYCVTAEGISFLQDVGIDFASVQRQRRILARPCLDWSERRYHLAGALGAALAERLFCLVWIERGTVERSVKLTARGRQELRRLFGHDFRPE